MAPCAVVTPDSADIEKTLKLHKFIPPFRAPQKRGNESCSGVVIVVFPSPILLPRMTSGKSGKTMADQARDRFY